MFQSRQSRVTVQNRGTAKVQNRDTAIVSLCFRKQNFAC